MDTTVKVLVATPFGHLGPGGIDRLNDMIIEEIASRSASSVAVARLVTRGNCPLIWAPLIFLRAIGHLVAAASRHKVHVLHLCVSVKGSLYRKILLARLARMLDIPYVVHLHGGGFDRFWAGLGPILASETAVLFSRAEKIVVLGKYWAQVVEKRVPNASPKLLILPNSSPRPTRPFRPSADGRVRITFLGELGRRKGIPQLLDALGLLIHRDDWTAILAGDGDCKSFQRLAKEKGIHTRLSFPGWLGPTQTAELLSETDIFVLPSLSENLPMSILEAISNGIAVVTTDVGAIPEVVQDNVNGIIVPPRDVQQLTAALARLIDDPELRTRLGRNAKETHAMYFSIESYVSNLERIWLAVSKAHG